MLRVLWAVAVAAPASAASGPASGRGVVSGTVTDAETGEVLTVRSQRCEDYGTFDPETQYYETYECGPYAGLVPIEAGGTYTVRIEAEGYPAAEATVSVPRRPTLTVTEEATGEDEPRRLRVRLGDPAGAGDLYGLSLFSYSDVAVGGICDNNRCRDTTYVLDAPNKFALQFETSDPLLVAGAREFDDNIRFAPFTDETFDGREKPFTISPDSRYRSEQTEGPLIVQVASLSDDVYDAYQIEYSSGGDDNPFAEPANLPSNVVGGYGLVGGVVITEVALPARE